MLGKGLGRVGAEGLGQDWGSEGRGLGSGFLLPREESHSPSGLVVVPHPETVQDVPGGSQRDGMLTFCTLDDILTGLSSLTSMMSLAWVFVE